MMLVFGRFGPVGKARVLHIDAVAQMSAMFQTAFVNQVGAFDYSISTAALFSDPLSCPRLRVGCSAVRVVTTLDSWVQNAIRPTAIAIPNRRGFFKPKR